MSHVLVCIGVERTFKFFPSPCPLKNSAYASCKICQRRRTTALNPRFKMGISVLFRPQLLLVKRDYTKAFEVSSGRATRDFLSPENFQADASNASFRLCALGQTSSVLIRVATITNFLGRNGKLPRIFLVPTNPGRKNRFFG